jgi:hypothetical protein
MTANPLTLASPVLALVAILISAAAGIIVVVRRAELPRFSRILPAVALMLLSLAAGELTFNLPAPREVTVLVDLSPSTRTAAYRDPEALRRRIEQLLGQTPHRVLYFADEVKSAPPGGAPLADFPAERTIFSPPPAPAVLLFSDGQFDPPAIAPRTYVVVDPILDKPPDASVDRLELRERTVSATVSNHSSESRRLSFAPGNRPAVAVDHGSFVLTNTPPADATQVSARLTGPADPWPENDRLTLHTPPPALSERWWVGADAPGGPWRAFASAADLPTSSQAYLAPAVIVLNDVAADSVPRSIQQRIEQYTRDLGGSLVIFGGPHSFAAGHYPGTAIETLSPLSSSPPDPTVHWLIVADSSGSMAQQASATQSKWDLVRAAAIDLLPHLPPEDPVSIGSFAESLRWWSHGKSARQTMALELPPAEIGPAGPTNLESALGRVVTQSDPGMPRELLLLTDASADIRDVTSLRQALRQRQIRLNVLVLSSDNPTALPALRELASATGGQILTEIDPKQWAQATRTLFQQASPRRLNETQTAVRFLAPLDLPGRSAAPWNRTWLKQEATLLATGDDAGIPLAARWRAGAGQVLATAFAPSVSEIAALAGLVAQAPRDPRFKVTWHAGSPLRVSIDAVNDKAYLNGASITLDLALPPGDEAAPQVLAIPQTAPGRYELTTQAPRRPSIATVRLKTGAGEQVLDRTSLAGRYAPEFDAIGNNLHAMKQLATRTGGEVIPPTRIKPIEFPWPARRIVLTPYLAVIAALLLAAALVRWRNAD